MDNENNFQKQLDDLKRKLDDLDISSKYIGQGIAEQIKSNLDDFSRPDAFGKIFCQAADQSKEVDQKIQEIIKEKIKNSDDVNKGIEYIFDKKYQKSRLSSFLSKLGGAIFTIIVAVASAAAGAVLALMFLEYAK